MIRPEILIDGTWLKSVMSYGDVEWIDVFAGGTESITFSVARPHRLFRPGAIVELNIGGIRRSVGSLIDPTPGDQLTAEGLHRKAEDEPALAYGGAAIIDPSGAVDAAIFRGLPWAPLPLYEPTHALDPASSTQVALDLDRPHSIAELLDASAHERGQEWWITPERRVRFDAWPTAPSLHMLPGVDGLTISRDGYASTLHARYLDSTTGLYETVSRTDAAAEKRWGRVPRTIPEVLGEGEPMTAARAIALVDGLLLKGASQIGWTSTLEVQYGDVVDARQQPVDPTLIDRQMVRLHGLDKNIADLAGLTTYDMPIARVHHRADGTALLEPRKLSSPMSDALADVA